MLKKKNVQMYNVPIMYATSNLKPEFNSSYSYTNLAIKGDSDITILSN